MAEMSSLLEIFADGGVAVAAAAAPRDLAQRLRSGYARPGLERLLAILNAGIEDSGDGRLGFQSWSREQIEAVLAVSRLVVAALLSASGLMLASVFLCDICLIYRCINHGGFGDFEQWSRWDQWRRPSWRGRWS